MPVESIDMPWRAIDRRAKERIEMIEIGRQDLAVVGTESSVVAVESPPLCRFLTS
jgi:hypothetical protein